ncbi:response regulator [Caldicellulosiruptoraceae bacterium PP1]
MFKVFLVEDEMFMREGLKNIIDWEGYGFKIIGEAEDGQEALNFLIKEQVDLLLTDIKIPIINGLELIKRVKENIYPAPEIIVISGFADFEYARTALRYGVSNYLLKPVEEEELIDTLLKIKSKLKKKSINIESNTFQSEKLKEDIKNRILSNNINLYDGYYLGIIYLKDILKWLNNFPDEKIDNILQQVDYTLLNLGIKNIYYLTENEGKYFILSKEKQHFEKVLEVLINKLNFLNEIVIALSNSFNDIEDIDNAIYESLYSLNFATFYKNLGIIEYSYISNNIKDALYSKEYDKRIIEAIESEDAENQITNIINDMLDSIKTNKISFDLVKAYINYIVISISTYFNKLGFYIENEIESFSKKQFYFTNIDMVNEGLREVLINISKKLKQWNIKNNKGILLELERYIRENYNKNLTLKNVAQKHFIHPAYLGQLFKKHYGMYFNSYLQKIRIEEAKKFLKTTDMKLYEISQKVGYNDTDYFIQCFTKYCNMTPNQYRKSFNTKQ